MQHFRQPANREHGVSPQLRVAWCANLAVCELPRSRDSPSRCRACDEGQVRHFRFGSELRLFARLFLTHNKDRLSSCRYHHVGTPVLLLKRNMILAPSVIEYFGFHVAFGSVVDINRHRMIAFVVCHLLFCCVFFAVYLGCDMYLRLLPHRNSQRTLVADAYRTVPMQVPPESLARSRVARLHS